jgi:hypothetical protein
VKKLTELEEAKILTKLTPAEIRGLLQDKLQVVERFATYMEFPAQRVTVNPLETLSQIRHGWRPDSLTVRCIESLESFRVETHKLVMCKPGALGHDFGGPYQSLLSTVRQYGLRPLPPALVLLLQEQLLNLGTRWTRQKQLIAVTKPINFAGSKLIFKIGLHDIKAVNLTTDPLIKSSDYLLLGKE